MGDGVGQGAAVVLVVEGQGELVQGQVGATGCEGQGVEAVVPAPHLVHPVLGHQHPGPGDQPGGTHGRRPDDVGGQFGGGGRGRAPRGHLVDELRERAPCGLGDRVERRRGRVRRAGGVELLDRDLPGAVRLRIQRDAARAAAQGLGADVGDGAGQHGDAVAAPGLVGREHVRVGGRVAEEVRSAERGEGLRGRLDADAQAAPPQAHGVGRLVGEVDASARAGPAEQARCGLDAGVGPVARRRVERDEAQDGVHAVLVRDEVEVLGVGLLGHHG